jgi:hypothetical protein
MQLASSSAITDAIEQFARAAYASEMPDALLRALQGGGDFAACGAELRAELKPFTGSAAARELLETPPPAPTPTWIRRWLVTTAPHISLLVSPLQERGPPTR